MERRTAGAKRQQKHYAVFLHTEQSSTRCYTHHRSRPLSTAASGHAGISLSMERAKSGKTRPETTSLARIRRRAQAVRNRDFSRVFTATSTGRSSTANSTRGGSRGRGRLLPPGTPSNAITLDEAFIIPIHPSPMERTNIGTSLLDADGEVGLGRTSPGRLNSASVTFGQSKVFDGLTGTAPSPVYGGRLPSAMKKSRDGSRSSQSQSLHDENTNNLNNLSISTNNGNDGIGFGSSLDSSMGAPATSEIDDDDRRKKSDPFHIKLENRRKARKQLNTTGSLFLGSGLGLRKEID